MSHRQIARLVAGLLLAIAVVLLVVPTSYERSSGGRLSCGSVLSPHTYPADARVRAGETISLCKAPINNRVAVVLIVGVLGGGAFIVASQLGKRSSDGMSSSTGSTPKQSGTSVRPPVPPSADQRGARPKAGSGSLNCRECGRGVPRAAKFCPHCGESLSCPNPNCDAKPSMNGRFCDECGWDLKTEI